MRRGEGRGARGELKCEAESPTESEADSPLAILISPNGSLSFVWDDQLQPFCDLGRPAISRASHVEPTAVGLWTADLGPSCGPVLGPFTLRAAALEAERDWLRVNRGL